jgi:tRNA pseudouridine-54 N-methylase
MSDVVSIEEVAVKVTVVLEFSAREEVEVAKVIVGAESSSVIVKVKLCEPDSVALAPEILLIVTVDDSSPS